MLHAISIENEFTLSSSTMFMWMLHGIAIQNEFTLSSSHNVYVNVTCYFYWKWVHIITSSHNVYVNITCYF
jgi:hypothetical protein